MTHSLTYRLKGIALGSICLLVCNAVRAGLDSNSTVFIILMENHDWSSIRGSNSAPYINNTLLPMASRAEQYYNPPKLHPSEPNYIWLEAGSNLGITNDSIPSVNHQSTTNHFVTQLKNAGISWTSYQEDITGTSCPLTNFAKYFPKHNPMVFFDDVTGNPPSASSAYCIANVRPYSELATDLINHTVSHYNFLVPNQCNDMHDTCTPVSDPIKQGDNWLANNIPTIMNSAAYSNGVIFITWDEGTGSSDGPIGMIVLSPFIKAGGYTNTVRYTHSSTLRTMQKIFDVRPFLRDVTNSVDLSDLFVPGTIPNGDPFAPDGSADSTGYLLSATNMYVWAAVNGTTLYVATWSPGTNGPSDHFIFVTDQLLPTASAAAPWSKAGNVAVATTKPYLAAESTNAIVGWMNAPAGAQASKWPSNTRQMEGTIDLVAAFGPGIMTSTVYIAAAAYGTANGGVLVSQGPASLDNNGNIDSNEFLALPVTALLDRNLDGVLDRLDPGIEFVVAGNEWIPGTGYTLTWNCVPGKIYQIQYVDAPGAPTNWQDLPVAQLTAGPGQTSLSFTDSTAGAQRLYRVKLLNP